MFPIPEGMKIRDFRDHPVRQALQQAAHRDHKGLPSHAELEALHLSGADRATLVKACREVADRFAEGLTGDARDLADAHAARIIGDLPVEQRDPRCFEPAGPDMTTWGPAKLADHVLTNGRMIR